MRLHHSQVTRIWAAHRLKPHRIRYFKLSTDPRFVEKVRDVVGLYVAPPERAIGFSFDEKSQIQALDRTQPGLPLKKGRAGTISSWLNLVVRFFGELTQRQLACLSVHSVGELGACIDRLINRRNEDQSPLPGPPRPNSSSRRCDGAMGLLRHSTS